MEEDTKIPEIPENLIKLVENQRQQEKIEQAYGSEKVRNLSNETIIFFKVYHFKDGIEPKGGKGQR